MDELLAKYMIGEATPAEMELVVQWVKESEYNKKYFAHFKLIWETSKELKTESKIDVAASWEEFKKIRQNATQQSAVAQQPGAVIRPLNGTFRWMKIAAIWVSVVGIAGLIYTFWYSGEPKLITLQSYNTITTDTLSDGSVITLNKNSVITYPEEFTGNTRSVRLINGEAFFSIAHDHSKPFLVHLNDAVVKVVGTSFNISNNKTAAEIIVETGIVEVIREKVIIRLKPTEKAAIDYKSGAVTRGLSKDNFYNYYRTKEFVANQTPLWRVVEVLNAVYQVNIQIPDQALANRTLTTTLRLGALEPNLELIATTFKVQIVHQAGKIIIR